MQIGQYNQSFCNEKALKNLPQQQNKNKVKGP